MTEITTDTLLHFFQKSDDKVFIRNIYIKCTIIIIVQHTIAEILPFIVQYHKTCNKINIYPHPHNIDFRKTNNNPCIVYGHLLQIPMTERISK